MRFFLFYIILILLSAKASAQQLDSILHRYFLAIGGLQPLEQITSSWEVTRVWENLSYHGSIIGQTSSFDNTEPTVHERILKSPNLEKCTMKANGKTTVLYWNDIQSGIEVSGIFLPAPKINFLSYASHAHRLYDLRKRNLLKLAGTKVISGRDYHIIQGPYKPGEDNQVGFCFDPATGLLTAILHSQTPTVKITYLLNYQKVANILTPFLLESYDGDVKYARHETISIEFNPMLAREDFYYKQKTTIIPITDSLTAMIKKIEDFPLDKMLARYYPNQRVFIDLWATWCAPCKIEFIKYDSQFYATLKGFSLQPVFISIDRDEDENTWQRDISKFQLKGDHIRSGPLLMGSIKKTVFESSTVMIPRYVLINENGKILSKNFVKPSDSSFQIALKRALER
jgi:thiol-disulfide isomerase/thioredoxin